MSGIKDQNEIDSLRRRLYERGQNSPSSSRHDLTDSRRSVPGEWSIPESNQPVVVEPAAREENLQESEVTIAKPTPPVRRRYRSLILIISTVTFMLVAGITSIFLFLGGNQISSANISIDVTGPLSVGGGEPLSLQIEVANQNRSPIESAVLIVQYPSGTRSTEDGQRAIFEERIPIDNVGVDQISIVPVQAIIFGEENQERTINVTLEYRMTGSGGTFSKKADPFEFKISSSPLVIDVQSIGKVAAGQEVTVTLNVRSNATAPLRDILVSAVYPSNFDYTSAVPNPSHRTSEWLISEIAPTETKTIRITGAVVGQADEEFRIQFTAGAPQQGSQFTIGSILANATADFTIEQPFIEAGISFNGQSGSVVTLQAGQTIEGVVTVRNTLSDTLYDLSLEAALRGNVLRRQDISVDSGFYNSSDDTIRWNTASDNSLQQIAPGQTKTFKFTMVPNQQIQTPSFAMTTRVFARRVSEGSATEQLVGTADGEVKFTSAVTIDRQASFVSGPVPPVADQETVYGITLVVGAGGNDITGAVVTSALPQYVAWKDVVSGEGSMQFNPVSQEVTWTVGDVAAGTTKQVTFQVGLRPSQNQIGSTPALLGTQRLRATDRFTGDVVRGESVPVSSELAREAGYERDNGRVAATAVETNNE